MASRKVGTVTYKRDLSSILTIFRLMPESGTQFQPSKAGQYIALRRDDCRLTRKTGVGSDDKPTYGPAVDESGQQKIGPGGPFLFDRLSSVGAGSEQLAGVLRGTRSNQEG